MKRLILYYFLVISIIFLFTDCTPKEREHTNPYDPAYTGTTTEPEDGTTEPEDGTTTYHTGVISFDTNTYVTTSAVAIITLTDADLTNATQDVKVISDSDQTGITLTLYSNAVSTYTGVLGFTTGNSIPNSKIKVADNDTVAVSYNDANPAGTRTDSAKWYFNIPNFWVYQDDLNYPASGFMGENNGSSLTITVQSPDTPYSGAYCWKIVSDGSESWAGIYIQYKGDWRANTSPPYADLSDYNTLVFYARATSSITIDQIGMGENGDSSGQQKFSYVNLTTSWQRFELNLSGDLSSINGLFYFSEDRGPYTIYFDNIFYTNK